MKQRWFQVAYLVDDLDEAMAKWSGLFGAGPFSVTEHHRTDRFMYRGTDQEADVSYAFGYLGDMMIQFIVQHDETPSIYRDMYAAGEEGYHHVAYLVHDFEAEYERLPAMGFEPACRLYADGVDAAYFDTRCRDRRVHRDPWRPAAHPRRLRHVAPGPRALPARRRPARSCAAATPAPRPADRRSSTHPVTVLVEDEVGQLAGTHLDVGAQGDGHLLVVPLHHVERELQQLVAVEVTVQLGDEISGDARRASSSSRRRAPAPPAGHRVSVVAPRSASAIVASSSPAAVATARRTDSQVWQSWWWAQRRRTSSVVTGSMSSRRTTAACHSDSARRRRGESAADAGSMR